MCLRVSDKSFPPPPPHPPTLQIITRSFVDNVVKRFKHLATCQASCNVPTISCNITTASKCAIFDKLQEKIRSIASNKVTGKSSEQSIKSVSQAACAYVCRTKVSPLHPHPENNHTVIRRQCCETLQAFCNVPSILQRASYLATPQHLLNAPSVTSYKRKFGA